MPKKLEELPESETGRKFAEEIMSFIFTKSQENLIANKSFDQGFLARSGKPPYWEGDTLYINYDAPYAMFVEYGTEPHPVSVKHLIGWVNRKLKIQGKKGVSVAYAVAMKIKKEGTDPKPFLRPAVNSAIIKYNLTIAPIDIMD